MNLIPMIAEKLGVEIGEEFQIKGFNKIHFKLDDVYGLIMAKQCDGGVWENNDTILVKLCSGEYQIIKLTYKPKNGEEYWYGYTDAAGFLDAAAATWISSIEDYMRYKTGNCFRTRKDTCLKARTNFEKMKKDGE